MFSEKLKNVTKILVEFFELLFDQNKYILFWSIIQEPLGLLKF